MIFVMQGLAPETPEFRNISGGANLDPAISVAPGTPNQLLKTRRHPGEFLGRFRSFRYDVDIVAESPPRRF